MKKWTKNNSLKTNSIKFVNKNEIYLESNKMKKINKKSQIKKKINFFNSFKLNKSTDNYYSPSAFYNKPMKDNFSNTMIIKRSSKNNKLLKSFSTIY